MHTRVSSSYVKGEKHSSVCLHTCMPANNNGAVHALRRLARAYGAALLCCCSAAPPRMQKWSPMMTVA